MALLQIPTTREDVQATPRRAMTTKRRLEVLLACGGKCKRCGVKLGKRFDVDHDIPLELGGADEPSNLVALCQPCHAGKTATEDAPAIGKMRRRRKLRLDVEPTEKKGCRIQSAGFRTDITRGMDGRVKPRKSARLRCTSAGGGEQ